MSGNKHIDSRYLRGPFKISLGPYAKIVCIWCEKPVALRNAGEGKVMIQKCSRPVCEGERPTNHSQVGSITMNVKDMP